MPIEKAAQAWEGAGYGQRKELLNGIYESVATDDQRGQEITFEFAEGSYKALPVWPGEEDAMDVDEEETEVQIVSTLFLRLRFELTQVLLGCARTGRSPCGREGQRRDPPEAARRRGRQQGR